MAVQPSAADRREREDACHADVLRRLFETLTLHEREVPFGVAHGLANKEFAAELGITVKMVKVHSGCVSQKRCTGSVAQLVRLADRLEGVGYPLPMFDLCGRDLPGMKPMS